MFRRGQWVLFGPKEKIGIWHEDGVHLVDEKGETTLVVPNPHPNNIKAAKREHIPAARLKTASKKVLERFYQ